MKFWLPQISSGCVMQFGHCGSPSTRSAVPRLFACTPKRSRSTPVVLSAQPSETSPAATVAFLWIDQSVMIGDMSGRPAGGTAQVHWALHGPATHWPRSALSHCSVPSRTPFPQVDGGCTDSENAPLDRL